MLFGAQVKQAGGLGAALRRAEAMGAEVMQLFAQSPRQWRYPETNPARAAAFGATWPASPVVRVVLCHAPYLVNLGTADESLYRRSCACLADNLAGATAMGASGLVLHLGSHLGAGLDARLDRVAAGLRAALDGAGCPLLLENTAGAGGTIGRSFEELARVMAAAGDPPGLGMCLDTQHAWAAGMSFATMRRPTAWSTSWTRRWAWPGWPASTSTTPRRRVARASTATTTPAGAPSAPPGSGLCSATPPCRAFPPSWRCREPTIRAPTPLSWPGCAGSTPRAWPAGAGARPACSPRRRPAQDRSAPASRREPASGKAADRSPAGKASAHAPGLRHRVVCPWAGDRRSGSAPVLRPHDVEAFEAMAWVVRVSHLEGEDPGPRRLVDTVVVGSGETATDQLQRHHDLPAY